MSYRSEITGLRAVAVIAVLFYHSNFSMWSGGYLGVDVFFVISGYLITSIILIDLNNKTFKFRKFYFRRMKRLIPALYSVFVFSTIYVYFRFFPIDIENYSKSLQFSTLFISNIFFWLDTNYFSENIFYKPLAHTWSLGVEEQFYILLPVLLFFTRKLIKKNKLNLIFLILFSISFYLTFFTDDIEHYTKFYLLPTRAWELFTGSLIALNLFNNERRESNFLSTLGLIFIFISFTIFDNSSIHPGVATLPSVIGTGLIILFNKKNSYVDKILSGKIVSVIGKMSYSLYLVHYPIFVFFNYEKNILKNSLYFFSTSYSSFILLSISLIVGYINFRYVENKFRHQISNSKLFIIIIFFTSIIFVSLGSSNYLKKYSELKFIGYEKLLSPVQTRNVLENKCLIFDENDKYDSEFCLQYYDKSKKNIIIIGDSLAHNIHYGFNSLSEENYAFTLLSATGCPPLLVEENYTKKFDGYQKCTNIYSKFYEIIDNYNFDEIIVSVSLSNFEHGELFFNFQSNSKEIFLNKLNKLNNVTLIGPYIKWKETPLRNVYNEIFITKEFKFNNSSNIETSIYDIDLFYKEWTERNNVKYFSVIENFCEIPTCSQIVLIENQPYIIYPDGVHFTKEVSTYTAKLIFSTLIK